jgi:hypothetical protein
MEEPFFISTIKIPKTCYCVGKYKGLTLQQKIYHHLV